MTVLFERSVKFLFFLAGVLLCVFQYSSCDSSPAAIQTKKNFLQYAVGRPTFSLVDSERFALSALRFVSDKKGSVLAHYEKITLVSGDNLGSFIRLSTDDGETFGDEHRISNLIGLEEKLASFNFTFVKDGLAVVAVQNGNSFYSRSDTTLKKWGKPVQINDEQGTTVSLSKLIHKNENEIYCVWIDKRRGVSLIYFSSSKDGGQKWSSNRPIDLDFREGRQIAPSFVLGENGRLLVFWQDWRDRKTLADIRYTYSDDQGNNWIPSEKINDDEKEVWQSDPSVATAGNDIYIAFGDFREKGNSNDNDWNIYFAHSEDNGASWKKNVRLNDAPEGRDETPFLAVDESGRLFCTWRTTRKTLFGQFAFSYSDDKGESFSRPVLLTRENEMTQSGNAAEIFSFAKDKLLLVWKKEYYDKKELIYATLGKTSEKVSQENGDTAKQMVGKPLKYGIGETIFEDTFSGTSTDKWNPVTGIWDVIGGTYMGVFPNGAAKSYISFAKFQEPEEYVLRGRFRLDSVSHSAASLYFRADKTGLRHYVITNFFRRGAWLSVKDNAKPNGLHISGGKPIAQKAFSFMRDRWYAFRVVVTKEQIDYYVDEKLVLTAKPEIRMPRGRIGIGGFFYSPTYFDDISVSKVTR